MLGAPWGTENLQNDHTLVKYFGKICRPWSFVRVSSILKMCIVPWSDETQIFVDSKLKLMQYILAYRNTIKMTKLWLDFCFLGSLFHSLPLSRSRMLTWCVPRRSSASFVPSFVSKIRINVPRSPAVARRVPWIFSAKHVTADSCAIISSGARSVFAKSTIWVLQKGRTTTV